MVDLKDAVDFLYPYFNTVEDVLNAIGIFAGGVFLIYLIAFIVKMVFYRKIYKSFNDLKNHVGRIEGKLDKLSKKR